jgi:hypothetical protein
MATAIAAFEPSPPESPLRPRSAGAYPTPRFDNATGGGGQCVLSGAVYGLPGRRRHARARKFVGEMKPCTGLKVSVSWNRLSPKTKDSPGLLNAWLGALGPPPSVKSQFVRVPVTVNVP